MIREILLAMNPLIEKYYQLDVLHKERFSKMANENYLIVMNHTALFGLELYLLCMQLFTRFPESEITPLVWSGFLEGALGSWFKALGCKPVSVETGIAELNAGRNVLILPEGIGATDVRNEFNRFHTGYLHIVKEKPVKILPIGFYGVDQAIPWITTENNWLVENLMRPINKTFDFALLPKLPIFRPVKIVFSIGKPIMIKKESLTKASDIRQENEKVKKIIVDLVSEAKQHRQNVIESSMLNSMFHKLVDGENLEL